MKNLITIALVIILCVLFIEWDIQNIIVAVTFFYGLIYLIDSLLFGFLTKEKHPLIYVNNLFFGSRPVLKNDGFTPLSKNDQLVVDMARWVGTYSVIGCIYINIDILIDSDKVFEWFSPLLPAVVWLMSKFAIASNR